MSNHPYRQKAVSTNAPYPVEDYDDVAPPVVDNGGANGSSASIEQAPGSGYQTPVQEAEMAPVASSSQGSANGSANGSEYMGAKATPYPVYDSQTPPPVFAQKEAPLMSPNSNPLSATSSVTNLNLNHAMDTQLSKSENNLATSVPELSKFGHNRSVSSTSSFFHDRSDNASMVDFSQNMIQQYLGDNSSHLLPRIKTIELYRKNAKKSNDPSVLFQYAQYMLQTALMLDSTDAGVVNSTTNTPQAQSMENSPKRGPLDKDANSSSLTLGSDIFKKSHNKSRSAASLDFSNFDNNLDDKKLKRALLKEALFYLKKLADKGYVDAQYLLADAYSSGALGKIENREAFVLFQAAAKHGHVESAYRTSYCYEEGLGTGRDARKAVDYLKMAASKNHPAAMYKLGVYSFYGRMGLSSHVNTKKIGIKWLTRASNVANELIAAAPYELGKIYYNGFQDIVIVDKKYALELYAQAAALGHVQSAAILGQCYEFGDIVPQDSNLSIHYYTTAALGGDPESMLAMCAWYLVGSDPYLPKDETEAFEWAKRAAMCELPKAQFALANFYEKGIGCIKNVHESQHWYQKAAQNGDEKSLSRITNKELAASIQKKAKKRAPSKTTPAATGAQEKDCVIM